MKKNELAEVKAMDLKELKMKANSLMQDLAGLVIDKNMRKMKDLKMISKKKKDLARVLTVTTQKQLLVQLEKEIPASEEKKVKSESPKVKKSAKGEGKTEVSK